jgi:hypothetical protein
LLQIVFENTACQDDQVLFMCYFSDFIFIVFCFERLESGDRRPKSEV